MVIEPRIAEAKIVINRRQGGRASLDGHVDVVGHQAVGCQSMVKMVEPFFHQLAEAVVFPGGVKERVTVIPTHDDVVELPLNGVSQRSWHAEHDKKLAFTMQLYRSGPGPDRYTNQAWSSRPPSR